MNAALPALLSDIVDYAGLFPPAELPLDEAIRNFARYQGDADAWMLARFVCPTRRFDELVRYVPELFAEGPALPVSALGRSGADVAAFGEGFRADVTAIEQLVGHANGRIVISALETRLPPEAARHAGLADLLKSIRDQLAAVARPELAVYLEVPLNGNWRASVMAAVAAMGDENRAHAAGVAPLGFKLRTGGLEPGAFPTPEQVAFVLAQCREHDVPQKFTAGLHHPVRHYAPSVRCEMHGFLNVFIAGILARDLRLDHHDILAILEERDPRQFVLTDDGVGWNDWQTPLREVRRLRSTALTSFGSCSFDEPRADLRELGYL